MGYICGDNDQENGSLWYTYDGGRNWMQVPYSFPDLHRIIKSPHYLWIIGKSGFITKLKDKN